MRYPRSWLAPETRRLVQDLRAKAGQHAVRARACLVLVRAARGRRRRRSEDPRPDGRRADRPPQGLRPRVLGARAGQQGRLAAQLPRRLVPHARRSRRSSARRTSAASSFEEVERRRRGLDPRRRSRTTTWSVVLEKAPRIAVYIPPNTPPWDDAVTPRARVRRHSLRHAVGRGGAARRSLEVRLAAPPPRGLHRPARASSTPPTHDAPWYQEEERGAGGDGARSSASRR